MKRRWLAVVSSIAVLAGGGSSAALPPPNVTSGFDLKAAAARLDALSLSITGNVRELRATEALNYRRVEGGIADCMRAHGRRYSPLPFVDFYQDFADADLGYGNGRAVIVDSLTAGTRRFELNEYAGVRLRRAGITDPPIKTEDVDVFNGCTAPFDHRNYLDIDPPAGTYQLAELGDLLEPIYRDESVIKAWQGYDRCMKDRHGYVVDADRSDFLFRWRLHGEPGSASWRHGLAEMKAVFAADVDCRRPAYTAAMRLVDEGLDAWKTKHRTELLAVRRAWRERVATAANTPR